jgi:hypothetical protein
MAKFKKKPVTIEAIQLQANHKSIKEVEEFIEGNPLRLETSTSHDKFDDYCSNMISKGHRLINTLEGKMKANFGDWIIKGVNGEFYPCKPDVFEKTYELVVE